MGRCGLVGLFVNNKLASAPRVEGSNPLPDVFSFENNVSFEECIVLGWPREEDEEKQEQEQEDHGLVKQEERGRRRRRSDQERLREKLSVRLSMVKTPIKGLTW